LPIPLNTNFESPMGGIADQHLLIPGRRAAQIFDLGAKTVGMLYSSVVDCRRHYRADVVNGRLSARQIGGGD
jgi:hypothetical protein